MIKEKIEVVSIKRIKFPFIYIKALINNVYKYVKDYDPHSPFFISEFDIKETLVMNSSTILIKRNKDYFWCEQYEEIYKSISTDLARLRLARNTRIFIDSDTRIILTFKTNVTKEVRKATKYITHDVKRIIIKKD